MNTSKQWVQRSSSPEPGIWIQRPPWTREITPVSCCHHQPRVMVDLDGEMKIRGSKHLFPLRSADGQSEQVSWCQFPSSPSDISSGSTRNEQQTTASPQVHQSRSGTPLPPTLSFAQELALGFSVFLHGFPPSHSQFIRWDCDQITAFNSHRCVLPKFVQLLWTCVGLLLPQSPAARSSSWVRQRHTGKG